MKTINISFPKDYKTLSRKDASILRNWITRNILPIKSINKNHTSYGLKHLLDSDIHVYFTNDQFKGGMLDMGFIPDNPNDLNWCFNISEKSISEIRKRIDKGVLP